MRKYYCYITLSNEEQITIGKLIKANNLDQAKRKFNQLQKHLIKHHRLVIHYKSLMESIEEI